MIDLLAVPFLIGATIVYVLLDARANAAPCVGERHRATAGHVRAHGGAGVRDAGVRARAGRPLRSRGARGRRGQSLDCVRDRDGRHVHRRSRARNPPDEHRPVAVAGSAARRADPLDRLHRDRCRASRSRSPRTPSRSSPRSGSRRRSFAPGRSPRRRDGHALPGQASWGRCPVEDASRSLCWPAGSSSCRLGATRRRRGPVRGAEVPLARLVGQHLMGTFTGTRPGRRAAEPDRARPARRRSSCADRTSRRRRPCGRRSPSCRARPERADSRRC